MKKCDNTNKFLDIVNKYKVKCKCGHVLVIINRPYDICSWCGRKVYRSKKDEFEDKLSKNIKTH